MTCNYRTLGKYEISGCLGKVVHAAALEGLADASFTFADEAHDAFRAPLGLPDDDLCTWCREDLRGCTGGLVLCEDSYGFVTVETYPARASFDARLLQLSEEEMAYHEDEETGGAF